MPTKLVGTKSSQAKAQREQAMSGACLLFVNEGIIVADAGGKIERVNQQAMDLLGFTEKDLIGAWYPSIIKAEDETGRPLHTIARPISKAVLSEKTVYDQLLYIKKDGSALPASVIATPIMLGKKPVGVLDVFW